MIKGKKDTLFVITLLCPLIVLLLGLILYPLLNAVLLSLTKQLIYELRGQFVGLLNYIKILNNPSFWNSFKLSLIWATSTVILQIILGTAVALLLNQEFFGRTLARSLILLPFFMPTVSVALMWRWLYNDSYGIINQLLLSIGFIDKGISWLGSPSVAMISLIFVGLWRFFPFVVINVLARMQIIDPQLYEAAKIDGANSLQRFWYITLHEIKGVVFVVILLRWIFMFNKLDLIWIISRGGPGTSTETLPILSYRIVFEGMKMGIGSAIAILTFLIVFFFILLYMKVTKAQSGINR